LSVSLCVFVRRLPMPTAFTPKFSNKAIASIPGIPLTLGLTAVAFVIQQSSCYNFFLFRDFLSIFFVCRRNICKIFCAILLKPARQHLHHNNYIHRTWFMHHDYTRKLRVICRKVPYKDEA
jgi:hypothetical protein